MTYIGHHTLAVQRGLNLGVALFIVSEALFFLAIFWTFFHNKSTLWLRVKFRKTPKTLITKDKRETSYPASLITEGMVTLLRIKVTEMGNRGSKSVKITYFKNNNKLLFSKLDNFICKRATSRWLFKIYLFKFCKVYSSCQGNLVYIHG